MKMLLSTHCEKRQMDISGSLPQGCELESPEVLVQTQNPNPSQSPKVQHVTRATLIAQSVKNLPAMQQTQVQFLDWEDPLEKGDRLPTPVFLGFPCGSAGKESVCNAGDWV